MAMKHTQAETGYGRGNPIDHCGICRFYQTPHRCSAVMGNISPYGICDVYRAENSPFGRTLAPNEIAAIKNMAADAADRSGEQQGA
jgi:hypothetical protein